MKRHLHPHLQRLALTTFCFFLFTEITFATNFGFLPGDACFHTTLTREFVEKIQTEKDPVFAYIRPKNASQAFCGYGGFFKLKYSNMPKAFKTNLKKVYQQIRNDYPLKVSIYPEKKWSNERQQDVKTGKIIQEELNPIHVFFVNADFDLKRFRIGLKYNETWAEEMQAIAKHKLDQTHLDLFVESGSAVMMDWRDAKLVRKLDTKCPDAETKNYKTPIEVTGKLKAIVLPTGNINEYFMGRGYYVVDENKIEVVEGKFGGPNKEKGGLFQP